MHSFTVEERDAAKQLLEEGFVAELSKFKLMDWIDFEFGDVELWHFFKYNFGLTAYLGRTGSYSATTGDGRR